MVPGTRSRPPVWCRPAPSNTTTACAPFGMAADLGQVQAHGPGLGVGQHQGRAHATVPLGALLRRRARRRTSWPTGGVGRAGQRAGCPFRPERKAACPSRKRRRRFGELADAPKREAFAAGASSWCQTSMGVLAARTALGRAAVTRAVNPAKSPSICTGPKDAGLAGSALGWRGRVDTRAQRSRCSSLPTLRSCKATPHSRAIRAWMSTQRRRTTPSTSTSGPRRIQPATSASCPGESRDGAPLNQAPGPPP